MIQPAFLFLIAFLFDAGITCTGIVVNLHAQDLGATALQLGVLGFAWGVSYCAMTALSGRTIDRYPRRVLAASGFILFAMNTTLNCYARHPSTIIWNSLLAGLGCGLFWPTFETLLHVHGDDTLTTRNMGAFNVGWTSGIAVGIGSAGFLKVWGAIPALRFLTVETLVTLGIFLVASCRGIPPAEHAQDLKHQMNCAENGMTNRAIAFLKMAWISNFCLWFAGASISSLFPKLARFLAIPDPQIGLVIAVITAAQCLTSYALGLSVRWHYRMGVFMLFQLISVAGLGIVVCGCSPGVFALAMALLGVGRGMTYSASLFYGLSATKGGGTSTGIHETMIGLGFVFGPLLSGVVAQRISLRAPFTLCVLVLLLGMLLEFILWRRLRARTVSS